MKVWLRVCLGMALATLFVLSAVHFRSVPDPVLHGRTVSDWAGDLLSPDYSVRGEAQSFLKKLGSPGVPQLRVMIRKRNHAWEKYLNRFGEAVPFFQYRPVDASACRLRGAEMIGLIGPAAGEAIPDLIDALAFDLASTEPERALVHIGAAAIEPLARAVEKSSRPQVRERAARVLREFPEIDQRAIAALEKGISDSAPSVREQAALSLGAVAKSEETSAKALLSLEKDAEESVRAAALRALGEIGIASEAVIAVLRRGLEDRSVAVRLAASKSLWTLERNARATVPVLTGILRGYERRWEAAYALGEIGPEAAPAVPALVNALQQERISRPFRTPPSSSFALGKIGPAAIPALSQLLTNGEPHIRTGALLAFNFVGPGGREALPRGAELLRDRDPEVRHIAALTLPGMGARREEVVGGLAECLNDEDIYIRSAAAAVLRKIAPEQDWVVQPE